MVPPQASLWNHDIDHATPSPNPPSSPPFVQVAERCRRGRPKRSVLAIAPEPAGQGCLSMSKSSVAINNLRGYAILMVLAFHSFIAYLGSQTQTAPRPFDSAA